MSQSGTKPSTFEAPHAPSGDTRRDYLAAVAARVLVFDGAMGTNIQLFHPTAED